MLGGGVQNMLGGARMKLGGGGCAPPAPPQKIRQCLQQHNFTVNLHEAFMPPSRIGHTHSCVHRTF